MNEEMKKIDKQAVYDDIDEIIDRIEFECNEVYKIDIKQLQQRIDKAIEDIEFCLKSIYQEKGMSTDERTRNEMETCIQIFNETLNILKGEDKE